MTAVNDIWTQWNGNDGRSCAHRQEMSLSSRGDEESTIRNFTYFILNGPIHLSHQGITIFPDQNHAGSPSPTHFTMHCCQSAGRAYARLAIRGSVRSRALADRIQLVIRSSSRPKPQPLRLEERPGAACAAQQSLIDTKAWGKPALWARTSLLPFRHGTTKGLGLCAGHRCMR